MQIKPRYFTFFLSAVLLLTIVSCSTEKDALLNKGYHNMTARYNGYYNAGVIIKEALANYRANYQEDYDKLLPLDLYPSEDGVANMTPELEDAIERCSKVIVRHSMPNPQNVRNKKIENCRWIDDNWLVIGKAYYIKQDYEEAKEKLSYISESSFFKNEESIYEARIWLARTHIALGEYSEAKRILVALEQNIKSSEEKKEKTDTNKKKSKLPSSSKKKEKTKKPAEFPKKLKLEYELTMTELYIAQNEKKKAIEHLEEAVSLCRDRKRKARYMFVLAQLYAEQGNDSQAAFYYDKVANSNAPYEMRFKAKIKNALSASGNNENIVKELNKMLKDAKNLEYKDQIYYALAEIQMKIPDTDSAKYFYSNSVRWSIKNNRQKGISYLRLADISFNEKDYLSAQRYYDSCVQALPEDYEDYEYLRNKAAGLSELVYNYDMVLFQDSVQRISMMSPKEREKFLEKTIKDIEEKEAKKKFEDEQKLLAAQAMINVQQDMGSGGKKWYFSNPKQIATGFNDFRGLWGQRVLEDNWRRSNKSSYDAIQDENSDEPLDSIDPNALSIDLLMKDIPMTQSAMDSSNALLINALYNLGIIYKEQLKEEASAVNYFQKVIDRNVEHPKVLPSLYQLYLIYSKKGDPKAEEYKAEIIRAYPESEIAQILKDPDYLKKREIKDREELMAYSSTLRDYRMRNYAYVLTTCNTVIAQDSKNQFLNKYYLLKAFALSQLTPGNVESIAAPLEALYALDPTSEEGIQAKLYLDKLRKGEPIDGLGIKADSPYIFDADSKHFFMLYFPKGDGDVNAAKIKISNFNTEFYPNDALSLQDAPLGTDGQVLVVRSFDDMTKAKIYLAAFKSSKAQAVVGSIATDYPLCLITPKNFSELFKIKEITSYFEFYTSNY